MFIFQYMAGFVETITGKSEQDEDSYDPHEHRKVKKPTTYGETMTHLVKGCVGAGLLAMPDAMRRLGIVCGVIGLVLIGIFATYCILLLISVQYKICKKMRRGYISYPKTIRLAILSGPKCIHWTAEIFFALVDIIIIIWQLGVCAIYIVFVAENMKQICDHYGFEIKLQLFMIYTFPVLLLICMVKDLKLMSPISSISNGLTMLGLILVFFYLIETDLEFGSDKFTPKGIEEVPVFVGIVLFAIEAVGVVLALEYNMQKPRDFGGLCGLFSIGMAVIVFVFSLLGIFGYLKYGNEVRGVITLNLPFKEKKAQAAKITFALALYLSFPLQNYVAYEISWRWAQKWWKHWSKTKLSLVDYFLRIAAATIPLLLALIAPSLGAFMGLLGALCLSLVAVVFPAIMDYAIHYPNKYGFCKYKLLRDLTIIILGTFAMVSGCYSSVLEMIVTYGKH